MKNYYKIVAAIVLLLSVNQVFGQFYMGFNGGYNATAILNQNNLGFQEPDYQFTTGPSFGGTMGFQISHNTGVRMDINYVKQGQLYKDEFWDGNLTKKIDLDYMQIPIMFEWLPFEDPNLVYLPARSPMFYMLSGVQFGFLLDAEIEQEWDGRQGDAPTYPVENKDLYKSTDLAVVIEHGVQYFYDQRWFFNAGIRCVFGITDINESEYHIDDHLYNYLPVGEYEPSRNGTWGLNITVAYLLGQKL